ncbi:TetR/AcrR family transcriptional regulator [Sciscionella marina]|uniref:TetR/AcrR family transcriptional regulator n=1 Tax=Sciscionella marina TaxID=508770 RepID=UPI000381A5D4|nr:TetR/AcrR family transcriptional regulator [Sciscionella marina]
MTEEPQGREPQGRRERKKARTRQALADAALELFLERGFEAVSVKEIADTADVSVTTLFKHFPSKEALVFDQEQDVEVSLVAAVRNRPEGMSIPEALHTFVRWSTEPELAREMEQFTRLVEDTPVLREYSNRMWMRHKTALARAIAAESGAPEDDLRCAALAHFALSTGELIRDSADQQGAAEAAFTLLAEGWG